MTPSPSHPFFARGGFFILPALAVVLFAWPGLIIVRFAQADGPAREADASSNAEIVEVTARRMNETDNRPSALISTIESEDQGPGFTTSVGMLRQAPAVRVREYGGQGQTATIGLRGAAPNQTLILLDGVPLPDPTGTGFDLSILPAPFLDRIEILRGAASSEYGSGALGGVVNLVTRSVGKPLFFGRVTGGSFETWVGNVAASFPAGAARLLVAGSALTTKGDFRYLDDNQTPHNSADDRMVTRRNNAVTSGGLLLKGRWELPGAGTLALTQVLSALKRGVPGMSGYGNQNFAELKASESSWLSSTDLRVRYPVASASLSAGAMLRASGYSLTDPQGELTSSPLDDHQEYNQIDAFAALALPIVQTHLIQARLQTGSLEVRDASIKAPARKTAAGLLQADIGLWKEQLYLSPALRLDWTSGLALQFLPALGLAWRLTNQWQIKSNVGRAFRAPSFTELYLQGGYVVGDKNLRPESAWNTDLTVEWTPWQKMRLSVGGFYAHYQDLIIFEPFSNFRYHPLNIGQADLGGIEIEVGGPVLPVLEIALHYTFLLAIDRSGQHNNDGKDLVGRPRHTLGARLFSHLGSWLLELEGYFISDNFVTRDNTKDLPARYLFNVGIGRELAGNITVMAEGKNILNNQVQDVRGFPLPGISFFLTIGYNQGGNK
jgi:vitamin B12 transporter